MNQLENELLSEVEAVRQLLSLVLGEQTLLSRVADYRYLPSPGGTNLIYENTGNTPVMVNLFWEGAPTLVMDVQNREMTRQWFVYGQQHTAILLMPRDNLVVGVAPGMAPLHVSAVRPQPRQEVRR